MDTLKINTSQNIDIEQSIASIGERIVATIIDYCIITVLGMLIMFISGKFQIKSLLFVGYLPLMFYSLLSELLMNGQSWGKKIMKIKVVKIDGTTTGFASYFLRWIIGLIEIITFFGSLALITIIINRRGQRLGDMAGNTTVVRQQKKRIDENLIVELPLDYQVVFPEVSKLTTNDIRILEEVVAIISNYTSDVPKKPISQKARAAIEKKLNIKSEMKTVPFFETIIRDYNFINSRT